MIEADEPIRLLLDQLASSNTKFRDALFLKAQHLSGGAINRNDRLTLQLSDGSVSDLVMRRGRGTPVPGTLSRDQEFKLVHALFHAGVTVPEPIGIVQANHTQASFFRWCNGLTDPRTILKSYAGLLPEQSSNLAMQLGATLGVVHSESLAQGLESDAQSGFTCRPADGVSGSICTLEESFRQVKAPPSYLVFAMNCICDEAKNFNNRRPAVLCHNDFRLGNLMFSSSPDATADISQEPPSSYDDARSGEPYLAAILDWEFAQWGDPMADLGWLTATCWRFGGSQPVAGFLPLEPFLAGYRLKVAGFDDAWLSELSFWQRFAHLRWAIIACQQGERALSTREETLELMITGLMTASIAQPVVEHYLGRAIEPFNLLTRSGQINRDSSGPHKSSYRPEASDLLGEAWQLLRQQVSVSDSVKGKLKYQILMAANAVRLAMASDQFSTEVGRIENSVNKIAVEAEYDLARDLAVWNYQPQAGHTL
jgi:aminoglycoside phosphotransferase (APT) family kinase protein